MLSGTSAFIQLVRPALWNGVVLAAYAFELHQCGKPWRIPLLTTTSTARFSGDWPAGFIYERLFYRVSSLC